MFRMRPWMAIGCLSVGLHGCMTAGPDYHRPDSVTLPGQWQATLPRMDATTGNQEWWQQFRDETLSELLQATLSRHPGLEAAQGAIAAARAALTVQQAGDQPTVRSAGQIQQAGHPAANAAVSTMTSRSVALDASWELDLFGRVKRATEGAEAKVAARTAEWQGLKISLAAETASLYNELRTCERLVANLDQEVTSRQMSQQVASIATRAGLTAPADAALIRARVAETRSRRESQQAECALAIKGLVLLTGLEETKLRARLQGQNAKPLIAPALAVTTLPTQLLVQRPDLAAAEQELIAANAEVGVAEAARYPRFSLLGNIGIGVVTLRGMSQQSEPWSFGPALSWPVLDGGFIEAGITAAKARHAMALASFRAKAREAVREVETALVNLDASRKRVTETRSLAAEVTAYHRAAQENWRTGGISRLILEEAHRQQLEAERSLIQLEGRQVQHGINLYKALGGGWELQTS